MTGLNAALNIKLSKEEGLKRVFKVIVLSKFIAEKMKENLTTLAASIQLPGFRPGKVPPALVEKRFGSQVRSEVLEEIIQDSCDELLKQHKIRPALQPKVSVDSYEDNKDLELTFDAEILPDIKLMDFSKLAFERLVAEPGQDQIQKQMKTESRNAGKILELNTDDATVQMDDIVIAKTSCVVEGKNIPELSKDDNIFFVSTDHPLPELIQQCLGAKINQTKKFKMTFPETARDDQLKGKEAEVELTVKEIRRIELPPINEELAQKLGFGSLEEWENETKAYLKDGYAKIAREIMKHDLLHKLDDNHDFALPTGLIDLEYKAIISEILKEKGIESTPHTHVHEDGTVCDHNHDASENSQDEQKQAISKLTKEEQEKYKELAHKRVKIGLILAEVSIANNIKIGDGELRRALTRLASQYPGKEKKVMELYQKNPEALNRLRAPLLEEKVVDFVLAMAQISDKNVSYEELIKAQNEADNHC